MTDEAFKAALLRSHEKYKQKYEAEQRIKAAAKKAERAAKKAAKAEAKRLADEKAESEERSRLYVEAIRERERISRELLKQDPVEVALADIANGDIMMCCNGGGIVPQIFGHNCTHPDVNTVISRNGWTIAQWMTRMLPVKHQFGDSGCVVNISRGIHGGDFPKKYNTVVICEVLQNQDKYKDLIDKMRITP